MDNLVGFAYGYAWMSRKEWFEVVSTELTSLLNQPICKEKIVVIRPVFTDIGALGYAVLAFDEPVTLEQVLEMDKNLPQALRGKRKKAPVFRHGDELRIFFDKFIRCVYFIYCLWYI